MALTHCSECNGKVSDQAIMCPHCGFGLQKKIEIKLPSNRTENAYQDIIEKADVPNVQDERRTQKRINIKMMAKIDQETARICNISKGGMKLATAVAHHTPNITITLDNGENIMNIKGVVRWVGGKRSFSNIVEIGVEISAAPQEYYQFIDRLLAEAAKK
ncbi:MAG: PilZ domain-containing protein [Candidatus Aminicenantes bacterium]|nr:PilZ domain-containing protein [Candidatus Aminicenantes bacterium]